MDVYPDLCAKPVIVMHDTMMQAATRPAPAFPQTAGRSANQPASISPPTAKSGRRGACNGPGRRLAKQLGMASRDAGSATLPLP